MATKLFKNTLLWNSGVLITPSTENTMLPAENLRSTSRSKPWRTTAAGASETLTIDLTSAKSVELFAFQQGGEYLSQHDSPEAAHNLGTIKIQGNASDSWGSPSISETISTYDQPAMRHNRFTEHVMADNTAYRFWRFIFTKTFFTPPEIDMKLVFFGGSSSTFPTLDDDGLTIESEDFSSITTGSTGVSFADQRQSRRNLSLKYSSITNAEKILFEEWYEMHGTHTPFYVQPDDATTGAKSLYYVSFSDAPSFSVNGCDGGGIVWDAQLKLIEEL
tara:strand:- start:1777 stop:2604 length:828 start_codon:yes stop_codon:yes gene_type:complete